VTGKATRHHTRDHNARLVFKTIYDQGETSRADIARLTDLTRPTVSAIVTDLLSDGFVVETGLGPSAGGKRPTLLRVDDHSREILCLDLSGSEFRGALVNLGGSVVARAALPAGQARGDAALDLLTRLVRTLRPAANAPLLGIGIGTPGLVNPASGVVLRAVNLDWTDIDLGPRLEAAAGCPVYVANDSHLAALAEYTYGPASVSRNLIVIRVGRGIGAGIILDGRPYYGDGYGAGEIGHVVVDASGSPCSCGNVGCLETVASTRAMLDRARRLAAERPESLLGRTAAPDWNALVASARSGDEAALDAVNVAGRALGVALANLVGCYHIRRIVLSGRVADLGRPLLDAAEAEMKRRVLPAMAEAVDLSYSALDGDAVLLGSAAFVMQHELGIV